MSFWGSVILPGLALGAIDRKYVDYKFRLMPINYEMTKFSRLNERVYFLPGGNQAINDAMFKCFKTNLGEKPFPLVQLNLIEKRFKEEIGNLWAEKKEVIRTEYEKHKFDVVTVDACLVGLSSDGQPFICNVNDVTEFNFEILNEPPRWMISPQPKPIMMKVEKLMGEFINKVMGLPPEERIDFAIEALSKIVEVVSTSNKFSSKNCDIIIINVTGSEIHHVRYGWFGRQVIMERVEG